MSSREIIGRWASLLLAEVLNLSASVAEKILLGQPRWLAQLRLLEADLREGAQSAAPGSQTDTGGGDRKQALKSTQELLEAYALLYRALKDIEDRGLALDDALVERMKHEWNAKSIVGYLQTCDKQLKREIGETLQAAAALLGATPGVGQARPPGPEKTESGRSPLKKAVSMPAAPRKPEASSSRPKDLVT